MYFYGADNVDELADNSKVIYQGFMGSWNKIDIGKMNMLAYDVRNTPPIYTVEMYKIVAAHEFGHMAGIGDGYGDNKDENENTISANLRDSIMDQQWVMKEAKKLDYEKMIAAHLTNKKQKMVLGKGETFEDIDMSKDELLKKCKNTIYKISDTTIM